MRIKMLSWICRNWKTGYRLHSAGTLKMTWIDNGDSTIQKMLKVYIGRWVNLWCFYFEKRKQSVLCQIIAYIWHNLSVEQKSWVFSMRSGYPGDSQWSVITHCGLFELKMHSISGLFCFTLLFDGIDLQTNGSIQWNSYICVSLVQMHRPHNV